MKSFLLKTGLRDAVDIFSGFTSARETKTQTNFKEGENEVLNSLATAIAMAEGKKHQASIGDIREILRIIVEFEASSMMSRGDSPLLALRSIAIERATKKIITGGVSCAKQGEAKVSKKNKVKARRNCKAKRKG